MISLDYLVGAIIGIVSMLIIGRKMKPTISKQDFKIVNTQSHLFEIVKPLITMDEDIKPNKNTQSYKYEEKTNVRVIIMDGNAFWIKDNVFYTARFDSEGIDKDSTSVVDIMGMSRVELDKMLFIMDQLREGKEDDSSSTGNN